MGKMKDALVKLAKKVTGKEVKDENSISNVVNFMADNYQGGGGSITGVYMLPMIKASKQIKGFSKATIDFEALLDYLKANGVDVDEPNFFDYNETRITLEICTRTISNVSVGAFDLGMDNGQYSVSIYFAFNGDYGGASALDIPKEEFFDAEQHSGSLRQIIMTYLVPAYEDAVFSLPTYVDSLNQVVANTIEINYSNIAELLCYELKDVDGFLKDVLVEYNPGSGSDSGSN